jgi:NAD(P)-dependent dehydrogenase (short-subunit alcohol dehydrogenase family)
MTAVEGRTAFITGGANGIGLGIARSFARSNVALALADIDEAALKAAKDELSRFTRVETVILDTRDRSGFLEAADRVEAELGPVSIVVNNAGVGGGAPVKGLTYELWDWALGINLGGIVNGVQTFLGRMLERGEGGHLINTASAAGLAATWSGTLYHTAKFAVVGMSEALALELEPLGIGVTVLCPGPVATDIIARTRRSQPHVFSKMSDEEREGARGRTRQLVERISQGVSTEIVGELVLAAVRQNQLYVLTDPSIGPFVEARCQAILAALPAGDPVRTAADLRARQTIRPA